MRMDRASLRLAAPVAALSLLVVLSAQSEFQCEPIEPVCVEAGGIVPVVPDAAPCCEGLTAVSQYDTVNGACLALPGAMVCILARDGVCGAGEDFCNSPGDCPEEPECTPEGEAFGIYPGAPSCCEGLVAVGCDAPSDDGSCMGCEGASYCTYCGDGECGPGENVCRCPEDCGATTECTPEGESYGIYPGALPCCDGLVAVGCASPAADGTCLPCAGASFCTNCGDGVCGEGENMCRCPEDCR